MIPKLFTKDAETFETNGLGRLSDAVSCIVTEELNGEYSLTMKYPTTGRHYDELEPGLIIYADNDTTNNPQAFRIATIDANATDGTAEVYAPHISYDLSRVVVMPFTANNVAAAIRAIGTNAANYCPFTFDTDKSVSSTYTLQEPHSARAMLGGETNSLLDVYGKGEYEFDNFDVYLHLNRGSDSGVTLRYGKNITELKKEVDTQGTFNGAVGFWKDATSGETVTGNIVKSEYWNDDDQQTQTLGALDFSQTWQEKPTVAQIDNRATAYITENEPYAPKVSLNVSFVDLAQTEEFADIAPLMRLKVADRLTIYFPALGVNSTAKIVKAEYNVLADRFERLEVGNHRNSLAGVLKTGFATTDAVTQQLTDLASVLKDAQDNATALITGAQGGHVLIHTDDAGKPFEILIMDTESITTATKVWRWNVNGWGYSGTGYAGPYTTAATMDGAIVADVISTGTLNAGLVKAGILQDAAGLNYWNMESGAFRLAPTTTIGGETILKGSDIATVVVATDVEYGHSNNEQTPPAAFYTAANWTYGEYLWTRQKNTLEDGTITYSTPRLLADEKGMGVASTQEQYYLSTSNTSQTGGSWSDSMPAWVTGRYYWTRTKLTFSDGTVQYTTAELARALTSGNQSTDNLNTSLNQTEVFNRLTNNGAVQGIFLNPSDNKLYINADYLVSGVIASADNSSSWDLANSKLIVGSAGSTSKSEVKNGVVKSYDTTALTSTQLQSGWVAGFYNSKPAFGLNANTTGGFFNVYRTDTSTTTAAAGVYVDSSHSGRCFSNKTNGEVAAEIKADGNNGQCVVYRNGPYKGAQLYAGDYGGGVQILNGSNTTIGWFSPDGNTTTAPGMLAVNNTNGYLKAKAGVDTSTDCGLFYTVGPGGKTAFSAGFTSPGGDVKTFNNLGKLNCRLFTNTNGNGGLQICDTTGATKAQIGIDSSGYAILSLCQSNGWKYV